MACGLPRCPSLTITGLPGAGGRVVAPDIVDYLDVVHDCEGGGWLLVDDAFVAAAAGWDQGTTSAYSATLMAIARLGHCVVSCEGAAWLTRPVDNVFHAFLAGSEGGRATRQGTEPARSAWTPERLRARDEELRRAFADRFGAKLENPCDYHIVVNTDHFDRSLVVRTIADSLLEWAAGRNPNPPGAPEVELVKNWGVMPKICKVLPNDEA